MVNYCCVFGCGRNSRTHNHLNYYGLPNERSRQIQWLRAASREDLLNSTTNGKVKPKSRRFCSRHFLPSSVKSSKLLSPDAVPTLHLSGDCDSAEDSRQQKHEGLVCNSCNKEIIGFRYKCVSCDDYDLCNKCEASQQHAEHFMIRIPKPIKFGSAIKLSQKIGEIIEDHTETSFMNSNSESNDDEPITNYLKRKNYEEFDLSEDVKKKIRKEVIRALSSNIETNIQQNTVESIDNGIILEETVITDNLEKYLDDYFLKKNSEIQEVEFADVEDENSLNQVKNEKEAGAQMIKLTLTSSSEVQDSLSEFLIKNPKTE